MEIVSKKKIYTNFQQLFQYLYYYLADMLAQNVVSTLENILAPEGNFIALHEPVFEGNEWAYLKQCIDTGWVSSVGEFVDKFEIMLAEYTGVKRAVAVVNGTAALHVALLLVGLEKEDEVLVPDLTFVATANAVTYCGAIPHFVDCEERTLGLDVKKLACYLEKIAELHEDGCYNSKSGRRIKAVLPMHTFGHPVDLDPLVELCVRFKLELVEDATESMGSFYKGRHTGSLGRASVLSFNGNKIITTGGGGAILTNDVELGKLAKHLTTTAKMPHKWAFFHDLVGYNYRLPNINAAMGCAQLERLPVFLRKKRALAERYQQVFYELKGLRFFSEPEFARSNYWLNVLLLDEENTGERDSILELSHSRGIMTRPAWTLMHELPMFKDCPRMDLSSAEKLVSRLLNIPSSARLAKTIKN